NLGGISNFSGNIYFSADGGDCKGNIIEDCVLNKSQEGYGITFVSLNGECSGNRISGCSVIGHPWGGIALESYTDGTNINNTINNCVINGDGGSCIRLYASRGACNANLIKDNSMGGMAYGVYLEAVFGNVMGNLIKNCTMTDNWWYGVVIDDGLNGLCGGNSFEECTISGNSYYGVLLHAGSITTNIRGNKFKDCNIHGNGDAGFAISCNGGGRSEGNVIQNCSITTNSSHGIYMYGATGYCRNNIIKNCSIIENAGYGIYIRGGSGETAWNHIEGNFVSVQDNDISNVGINTESATESMLFSNIAMNFSTNFWLDATDTYGPIVTNTGALSSTGDSSHPRANFSR
ncbi:hypothetical protein BVX97_06340, partial [bacterium E08(2017)]